MTNEQFQSARDSIMANIELLFQAVGKLILELAETKVDLKNALEAQANCMDLLERIRMFSLIELPPELDDEVRKIINGKV